MNPMVTNGCLHVSITKTFTLDISSFKYIFDFFIFHILNKTSGGHRGTYPRVSLVHRICPVLDQTCPALSGHVQVLTQIYHLREFSSVSALSKFGLGLSE
jgi:hypothetical protein